nr:unnamed protein product [Callosobruchus analis]CAI5848133.1 unnamed protein product [Callosobruchus analis]
MKRFKTKKLMWNSIAESINKICRTNRTGVQVENRYKTLMKRKKSAAENNHLSGAVHAPIPFEEELSKIAAVDDSIQPEVIRSSTNLRLLKRSDEATASISTQDINRNKSVQEVLIELHQQKEESRERRHQEKMMLIGEVFGKETLDKTT